MALRWCLCGVKRVNEGEKQEEKNQLGMVYDWCSSTHISVHPPLFEYSHKMVWIWLLLRWLLNVNFYGKAVCFSFAYKGYQFKWLVVFNFFFFSVLCCQKREPSPFCWRACSFVCVEGNRRLFMLFMEFLFFSMLVFSISLNHNTDGSAFLKTRDIKSARKILKTKWKSFSRRETLNKNCVLKSPERFSPKNLTCNDLYAKQWLQNCVTKGLIWKGYFHWRDNHNDLLLWRWTSHYYSVKLQRVLCKFREVSASSALITRILRW